MFEIGTEAGLKREKTNEFANSFKNCLSQKVFIAEEDDQWITGGL